MTYATLAHARRRPAEAYSNVGLETQVLSASPEHLITLLFEGALSAIAKARLHMQMGNIPERGAAISKAIDIVDSGLKASVDREAGGEVATNLIQAYELAVHYLVQANLHADEERLLLAENILKALGSAWREACDPATDPAPLQVQS